MQLQNNKSDELQRVLSTLNDDYSLPWEAFPCLEWWASGMIWYGRSTISFYRLAYILAFGPIESRSVILRKCDNPACFRPIHMKASRNAHVLLRELLSSIPDDPRSCMEWPLARNGSNYGLIRTNGRSALVHRVAYELTSGPISDGLQLLHRCDNPPCFRPSHLLPGTPLDNINDAIAKGRMMRRGEDNPDAKLTEASVREIRELREHGLSAREIAMWYDVHPGTILCVINRQTWKHVI